MPRNQVSKTTTSFSKIPVRKAFDSLMAHFGANKYVERSTGSEEAQRYAKHVALGCELLPVVLDLRPRWKGGYGACVEYADGTQDFLEIGEHDFGKKIETQQDLLAYAKAKGAERRWREWIDSIQILATSQSGQKRRWVKMAVVFVARLGQASKGAATDVIRPLKRNVALPRIRQALEKEHGQMDLGGHG